jgi:RNA polymerase sigma factor (sigma-70 family)
MAGKSRRVPNDSARVLAWKRFEHEVREALELAGFEVQHDTLIGGAQTDLFAHQRLGGITTRLLVECKFSDDDKSISVDAVENFAARVLLLRNNDDIDHGFVVSNAKFSRFAKAAAKQSFVTLMTIAELYRRIFDLSPYVTSLKLGVESSAVARTFIHPEMTETHFELSEDEAGAISVTRAPSSEPLDIARYCDEWLREPGGGRLCLLGDYGAGKTTFCTWYSYRQAVRYLESPDTERIPLLISLRQYNKALDVKTMVTDFLVNECRVMNLRLAAFEALVRRGLFLVIVDGFDEMARYVDREVRYRTISDLSWLAQGASKMILTGRPNYFPSHEELLQILGASEEDDVYESARSALYELAEYRLYEVLPFGEPQIRQFIDLWVGPEQKERGKKIWKSIRETYNLLDLASRPVLLEMIVKSLPRLLVSEERPIINAARLYEIYTSAWIDRESQKGEFRKLIRKDQKIRFMEELAFQLFHDDRESLTYHQLGRPIRDFFKISDDDNQDFFSHDVRTCTFLHRKTNHGYEFVHRSFQEFFLAKKLLSDAARGVAASWETRQLPQEVARFASELIEVAKGSESEQLVAWARQDPVSILGKNSVWVTSLAGYLLPSEVSTAFQMDPKLIRSAVAFQSSKVEEGHVFEEFLYRRALTWVRSFLSRESELKREHEAEIVHDEFLSMVAVLRGKPPHTLREIDQVIESSIKWAHIGRERKSSKGREILFGDFEELWGAAALIGYTIDQERSVLIKEIFSFVERVDPAAAIVLARYYLSGESLREIANEIGVSTHTVKRKLIQATILAQKLVQVSSGNVA